MAARHPIVVHGPGRIVGAVGAAADLQGPIEADEGPAAAQRAGVADDDQDRDQPGSIGIGLTIGAGVLVVGCAAGHPGWYIFSQTADLSGKPYGVWPIATIRPEASLDT